MGARRMLDTGHFALENHCDEVVVFERSFYDRNVAARKAETDHASRPIRRELLCGYMKSGDTR